MSKPYPAGKASRAIGYVDPLEGLREPGGSVWPLWIASYAFGGALGSMLSSLITDFFDRGGASGSSGPTASQIMVGIVATFVFGAILGMANWLVLRFYLKDSLLWPLLTALGLSLGSTLAVMASPALFSQFNNGGAQITLLSDAANSVIIGLMIGLAQASLLARRVSDRAGLITIIVTSVLGWLGLVLLDWVLLTLTAEMTGLDPFRQIIILFLGFAVAGAISGYELPSLLKKHRQQLIEQNPDATSPPAGSY
jgi:hypothetical protein